MDDREEIVRRDSRKRNEIPERDISASLSSSSSSNSDSFCFLSSYGIEFGCLLFAIGTSNYQIAVQNFFIDRICHIEKNLTLGECHNLTYVSYASDEKSVEVSASEYAIYQSLIEYGLPILLSFFLGSWTDKNGSKPILIISLLGYFFASILYIIFSLTPDINPHYILFSSVPIALGGGLTALLLSALSYITRECPIQERSWRLGLLSVCFDGGATIGLFMGEKIFNLLGYTEVFMISSFLLGLSVLVSIFLIYERKPETSLTDSNRSYVTDFFDMDSVRETMVTCFKRRQSNRRQFIFILMTSITLQFLSYSVTRNYLFLFTRNKFGWMIQDYSNFAVIQSLMNNIGGLLMTLVAIKLLQITDIYLGLITTLSNIFGVLVWFFATSGWLMYFGSAIQMFGALTTAIMRSILSKCVDIEEHGKLFSFVTCLELSMPFVAGPLYGVIYLSSASTLPNAIFLVPIGINIVNSISYIYLHFKMENFVVHSPLRDDDERI